MPLQITFFGHQSWLVESGSSAILIDPILLDSFGSNNQFGFQIYPPRSIDPELLQGVNAILISHEHSDHFNLESLNVLPRTCPIFIGCLVVEPIKVAMERLGFTVHQIDHWQEIDLPDLAFRLYPSASETAYWESRVYQPYIRDKNSDDKFFVAVDALISKQFKIDLKAGTVDRPNLIAVSNNSQVTPIGVFGSLENRNAEAATNREKNGPVGLEILASILIFYLDDLSGTPHILICGCGFMKNYDNFGPFPFSNQKELGLIASLLGNGQSIYGPLPGETYTVREGKAVITRSNSVNLDLIRMKKFKDQQMEFQSNGRSNALKALLPAYESADQVTLALARILTALNEAVTAILLAPLGAHLMKTDGIDHPLVFVMQNDQVEYYFALDLHSAEFTLISDANVNVYNLYPFGVKFFLRDFIGILDAEIQIWDLAGIAMESWYQCEPFEAVVPFLYSYFGENTSPELLMKSLERQVKQIQGDRH